jgi:hypothetical protein
MIGPGPFPPIRALPPLTGTETLAVIGWGILLVIGLYYLIKWAERKFYFDAAQVELDEFLVNPDADLKQAFVVIEERALAREWQTRLHQFD